MEIENSLNLNSKLAGAHFILTHVSRDLYQEGHRAHQFLASTRPMPGHDSVVRQQGCIGDSKNDGQLRDVLSNPPSH